MKKMYFIQYRPQPVLCFQKTVTFTEEEEDDEKMES